MTGLSKEKILDRLPYLGLDIEGTDKESVRIEYNPNRAGLLHGLRHREGAQGARREGARGQAIPRGRGEGAGHRGQEPREGEAFHRLRGGEEPQARRGDHQAAHLDAGGPPQRDRQEEEEGRHRAPRPRCPSPSRSTTARRTRRFAFTPLGSDEADDRRGDTPEDRDRAGLRAHTLRAPRRIPCSTTPRTSSSRSRPSSTA